MPGGGTGESVENHVRKIIGWILFKTRNFYIFLDIQSTLYKCYTYKC